ncbi:unnamed protein product [Citrullus colocynthis]|uniref:Uncharacterized protein n=1 Tax=Citrullus colocynthis TaxID=252529 RepID=A0ABP0XRW6_9ROSI
MGFWIFLHFLITHTILSSFFPFSSLFLLLLWMYSIPYIKEKQEQKLLSPSLSSISQPLLLPQNLFRLYLSFFSDFSSFFPYGFCLLIRFLGVGSSRLRKEILNWNNLNFGIQKLNKGCSGKYQID